MNFLSMDYFLMTAEKRSFTKAADALHITQQTLSTHIANPCSPGAHLCRRDLLAVRRRLPEKIPGNAARICRPD